MFSTKTIVIICLLLFVCCYYFLYSVTLSTYINTTEHHVISSIYLEGHANVFDQTCNCTVSSEMADNLRSQKSNSYVWEKENSVDYSLCSSETSELGPHQRVISFSLFPTLNNSSKPPTDNPRYFKGIIAKAAELQNFYPNWQTRIYTYSHPHFNRQLCELTCRYPNIFICDIENLPRFGNISAIVDGRMWRFLPLVDFSVDIFISRDLDSPFSDRELAAVNDWIKSNKTFHVMRDNPVHSWDMLAGMWGAKSNRLNSSEKTKYAELLLKYGNNSAQYKYHDQVFLGDHLFLNIQNDLISHDSYFCKKYNALPFPTKRLNSTDFVGNYFSSKAHIKDECPVECRPLYGKDWKLC